MALLGSLQNFVGWDGASDISNEGERVLFHASNVTCFFTITYIVYNSGYQGNMNTKIQTKYSVLAVALSLKCYMTIIL